MIQLSYQPAFDAAHAIFRFLRIMDFLGIDKIEFDKLRILDYYLLFPFQAADIRLQKGDSWIRSEAKRFDSKKGYAKLPSREILFERMKLHQVSALQTMAGAGAAGREEIRNGTATFLPFKLPPDLAARVKNANGAEAEVMKIIATLQKYPLLGRDGLKDRTGLLEHRYDQV